MEAATEAVAVPQQEPEPEEPELEVTAENEAESMTKAKVLPFRPPVYLSLTHRRLVDTASQTK